MKDRKIIKTQPANRLSRAEGKARERDWGERGKESLHASYFSSNSYLLDPFQSARVEYRRRRGVHKPVRIYTHKEIFWYTVSNSATTSDLSCKLFNVSRCSTFNLRKAIDNCLKSFCKISDLFLKNWDILISDMRLRGH